jgi:hypothetical protein
MPYNFTPAVIWYILFSSYWLEYFSTFIQSSQSHMLPEILMQQDPHVTRVTMLPELQMVSEFYMWPESERL